MKAGEMHWFKLLGKVGAYRISKDADGYDVGMFSLKIINSTDENPKKALRLVIWRFAMWVAL